MSLYSVDFQRKLEFVRRIVSPEDGLNDIRDDGGGNVYVVYPHVIPTTVSVVHKERPEVKDEVIFNPGAPSTVYWPEFGLAAGEGPHSYVLFPLLKPSGPTTVSATLVAVRDTAPVRQPRISLNDWRLYQDFRYEGLAGGPVPGNIPLGKIAGNHVVIPDGAPFNMVTQIGISSIPPSLPADVRRHDFVVFATPRFFAFAATTPRSTTLYVLDRRLDRWKEIKPESTIPYTRRIFGSWMATKVTTLSPGNLENPGVEHERDWGTKLLPDVRMAYGFWWRNHSIPGTLILDNLEDGRRITLQTNEEDSEILDVGSDGLVLYRINDSIFSAQIDGDKLSAPTLVVQDDDVPEVHWAFWSNAEPERKVLPAPRPPTGQPN